MSGTAILKSDPFLEALLPGKGESVAQLRDQIVRYNSQANEVRSILLMGAAGVGKTHIAKVIAMHRCWHEGKFAGIEGDRTSVKVISELRASYVKFRGGTILKDSGNPYQEVNLPSLEGPLAASELFGYAPNAFTGAD